MKWALLLLLAFPAFADQAKAPDMSPPDTWVKRDTATLRVLNKIESSVQQITLRVGEHVQVGPLTIALAGCDVRPPDLPQDATAHLTITDAQSPAATLFDGWMLQKEPGLNMLEHPVYDVQLAGCS